MSAETAVIGYERALLAGTARMPRGREGAVTVVVARDTARRALYALTRPLVIGAAFCAIPMALVENPTFPPVIGIIGFGIIGVLTARSCFRIAADGGKTIVFRADAAGLQVVNPLGSPADQFYGPDEIIAIQLNRISLIGSGTCFQLELRARTFWRRSDNETLLVSEHAEVLDKIGRTLALALRLPEPRADLDGGWTSYRPPVRNVESHDVAGSAG
jgi:hypothetical protein